MRCNWRRQCKHVQCSNARQLVLTCVNRVFALSLHWTRVAIQRALPCVQLIAINSNCKRAFNALYVNLALTFNKLHCHQQIYIRWLQIWIVFSIKQMMGSSISKVNNHLNPFKWDRIPKPIDRMSAWLVALVISSILIKQEE